MSPRATGLVIGLLLGVLAWVGNLQRVDTFSVSTFPDLLTVFAVPVTLYLALRAWDRRHPHQDLRHLRRVGWSMVHAQAAAFALCIAIITGQRLSSDASLVAFGFTSALVAAAGMGYVSVEVWARLIVNVRAR